MEGGRDIAPTVNLLLAQPAFVLKVATQDWHPASHVSFAANHEGKRAFVDTVLIRNPADDDDNSPFVTSVQSRTTKARAQNSADSEEYDELDSDGDGGGKGNGRGGKARELAIEEDHRQVRSD